MKSLHKILVIVTCYLFCFSSSAQVNNVYIEKIASQELAQIKQTAQHFAKRGGDVEALDVLAEYLWVNYKTVSESQLDTFAWICRALSTNKEGRYVDLLTEIDHADVPKKLAKHAAKSLKKQEKYRKKYARNNEDTYAELYKKGSVNLEAIYATYVAPKRYVMKPNLNAEQQELFYLLDNNLITLKKAAMRFYNREEKNTEVLDVLAEVLAQGYSGVADYQADTYAWLAKALGASENSRYSNLLTDIINSQSHKKVRKHAKKALRNLSDESSEQYAIGSVNLDNIRDMVATAN